MTPKALLPRNQTGAGRSNHLCLTALAGEYVETILKALRSPLWLLLGLCVQAGAASATGQEASIAIGHSVVALDGPWKFHTGDDPRWAEPTFDDSAWESVDLSAPPDANDGDVGITPYTSGWSSKGHPGYQGYAWYRLRFAVTPPSGETLALLGPWAVDSSYQVYVGGILLGGVGDFSGATPTAYGYHYPRFFALPPGSAGGGTMAIAIRVWMGPWGVAAPGAGGIHIAPAIGEREAITGQYRLQWLKIFEGYAVDVVPALMFFLAVMMVLSLWPLDRADRTYPWLAAALLFSGIQRGNQAFFFWWQIETVQGFVIFILALTSSLCLGTWVMAWRSWFKLDTPVWLPRLVAALMVVYGIAQLLARPWMFHAAFPHPVSTALRYLISCVHLAFLLIYLLTAFQGIRRQGREGWYALPAMLAIGVVLFITELVFLHVPGIWFPFGVGLSITECASAIFVVLLSGLLLRRLWSRASRSPLNPLESRA